MSRTFRFDDHLQHEAKFKDQPRAVEEVLFSPHPISCTPNDEIKEGEKTHVFPPDGT
jgi:hypothetical protein